MGESCCLAESPSQNLPKLSIKVRIIFGAAAGIPVMSGPFLVNPGRQDRVHVLRNRLGNYRKFNQAQTWMNLLPAPQILIWTHDHDYAAYKYASINSPEPSTDRHQRLSPGPWYRASPGGPLPDHLPFPWG